MFGLRDGEGDGGVGMGAKKSSYLKWAILPQRKLFLVLGGWFGLGGWVQPPSPRWISTSLSVLPTSSV